MAAKQTYPELSERQKIVFGTLIEQHISSAQPIGSKHLAQCLRLGLSSATVRNVLAELEEYGLLQKSHKSSGRIPTDFGYAYYVDSLMERVELPKVDCHAIERALEEAVSGGVREVLEQTSIVLSRISMLFAVVLAPKFVGSTLLKIDLVRMSTSRLLIILSINGGMVHSLMLDIDPAVSDREIQLLADLMNERLGGLKLAEVRRSLNVRLSGAPEVNRSIIRKLVEAADRMIPGTGIDAVHIGETRHVMNQPEFADMQRMHGFFAALEDPMMVTTMVEKATHEVPEGVRIGFGEELGASPLKGCGVVATEYSIGGSHGSLGVIGPIRMPYARMASLVKYTASLIRRKMLE